MSEATFFLFKALMDIFTIGVVFNFLFRLLKVDYYNPLVQGIIKAVDFPSQLLRSVIKPIYSLGRLLENLILKWECDWFLLPSIG